MSQRRPLPDTKRHPLVARVDERIAPAICGVHDAALTAGHSGYIDPLTTRWVFTAGYLWERANCCNNDCRHCPYATGPRYQADGSFST